MPQEYIILRDLDLEIDFLDEKKKKSPSDPEGHFIILSLYIKKAFFFFFLLGEDENISEKELIFQL